MGTLNPERPKAEYGCGEQDLYTVCETIANSYGTYVTEFEAYSTRYSATTGTDLLNAITNARAMPDEAQRDARHAIARKDLLKLKDDCLEVWQQLTSYIRDAFDEAVYDDQLNAAGRGYYSSAQNNDWDDVKGLMQSAITYVGLTSAQLTADGGMPIGFDVTLNDAKVAFEAMYDTFLQSLEMSRVDCDKKIDANNDVFGTTMKICEDGKRVFRKNPAVKAEFTFDSVLELVRRKRTEHGLSGVTKLADDTLIGQVELTLEKLQDDGSYLLEEVKLSDNDGEYKFMVKDGRYRLTAEKMNYVTVVELVEIDGGPKVVDFVMVAA